MIPYICDFDDWPNGKEIFLPTLLGLKNILPNLKVTLFTIPSKVNLEILDETKRFDWIELALHGFLHGENYEFAKLNKEEAKDLILQGYKESVFVKGFKAPGWQISEGTMEALKELGFWVAVQYNDGRLNGDVNGPYQPKVIEGLESYAFKEYPNAIHGHTWNCCGNGISEIWEEFMKIPKDAEFITINEYVQKNKDISL